MSATEVQGEPMAHDPESNVTVEAPDLESNVSTHIRPSVIRLGSTMG